MTKITSTDSINDIAAFAAGFIKENGNHALENFQSHVSSITGNKNEVDIFATEEDGYRLMNEGKTFMPGFGYV